MGRFNGTFICLAGKTAIVTGANTGLGYATALDFAMRGARVILACRNRDKAEEAQRKIAEATNNPNVLYKHLDMASLKSVREFAADFNATEKRLDLLINNAGVGGLGDQTTGDGLQITMQVNYFSVFLLTHLLLDKLKKSAPSRIVNLTSIAAKYARINVDKLHEFPNMGSGRADTIAYCNSKACVILFTTELAKKIEGTGVTVNTLHPGVSYTELFREMPSLMKKIFLGIGKLYFQTPQEGAQTSIYLALSKDVEGISGKLFDNCKEIKLYGTARDEDLARKVWQKSEELTKLSMEERII